MTLKEKIEADSFAACEKQQAAHKKAGIANHWTSPEVDCYEMGYEIGALAIARELLALRKAEQKGTFLSGKTTEAKEATERLNAWAKEVLDESR